MLSDYVPAARESDDDEFATFILPLPEQLLFG
jgi:hypothetical protein